MIASIPRLGLAAGALTISFWLSACSAATVFKAPLTFQKQVPLAADAGKPVVDLLTLDPRSSHLYIPHSSNDALEIMDLRAERLLGTVPNLPGIKGIAVTSDPSLIFTSDGGNGTVSVVDTSKLTVVKTIKTGGSPDAIDYDPVHDLVVVSLGTTAKLSFIDRKTYQVTGSVELPGKPGLMTIDKDTGRVFVAIKSKDAVVTIDAETHRITYTYTGCDIKGPNGLVYDPGQGRLFVADTIELSIIDTVLDKCLGIVDIGSGNDQIAFNPHTHHVYTANTGARNLSVIDAVSLKPLGIVGTGPESASVTVDPTTDTVYVAAARAGMIVIYHDP